VNLVATFGFFFGVAKIRGQGQILTVDFEVLILSFYARFRVKMRKKTEVCYGQVYLD
jgi:hypothetical protein